MWRSGGSGGSCILHISTALWITSSTSCARPAAGFRCFTNGLRPMRNHPRFSTALSTHVDNSTLVIYENPCDPLAITVDIPRCGYLWGDPSRLCTELSTGCGYCGQPISRFFHMLYGVEHSNIRRPAKSPRTRLSTNYNVDTQVSVDGFQGRRNPPNRLRRCFNARIGGTEVVEKCPRTRA